MRTTRLLVGLSAAIALGAAACGGSSGGAAPATTGTVGAAQGTVATAGAGDLGTVVVDASGMTLYLFGKDENGMSSCDGDCAAEWPPLTIDGPAVAGDGISAADLGTVKRQDGSTQVTYAGHPLYLFSGDSAPGDTNGEGLDDFGAEWYAVSGDGKAVEGQAGGGGMYDSGY